MQISPPGSQSKRNTDYTNCEAQKERNPCNFLNPCNPWILFVFLLVLCGYLPLPLSAMDWPTTEGVMVNNFGFNDEGRPVLGAVFEAEGDISAADNGELLFSRRSGDRASRLPSPLGAWIALDHGDGIISIYSRFEDTGGRELKEPAVAEKVLRNEPIARAGSSGWSNRKGFYFSLFDRRERRWVNPSMIITPFPDTRPPQVLSVQLKAQDGRLINPSQVRSISQGRYSISVAATDTRLEPGEAPLAPHRIVCSVNGTEIGSLNFETYSARDGVLMVYRNGLFPVQQVYAPLSAFEVGEVWFTRGQATLEIIAQDIAGNERSAISRLVVE
ncbi:hypothetical protein AGMMS49546_11960 [Spirochaetia bacterium]|nr:hypothetical protein AGMMS49546_11960 [Spirochaetia bacterium]